MLTATDELWGYRALVQNLTNRQLKSQYKESLFGNLWSMINPAATIGVYSLVFGVLLKFGRNIPGIQYGDLQSFPLYLFCGIIMWSAFNRVAIGAMGTFTTTGSLLKKVYFPPAAPIMAHALAQVKQTMLEGLIAMIVLAALGYFSWSFVLWPLLIPPMIIFSLGLGLVLTLAVNPIVLYGAPRYKVPVSPFIAMMAAVGLVFLAGRLPSAERRRLRTSEQ